MNNIIKTCELLYRPTKMAMLIHYVSNFSNKSCVVARGALRLDGNNGVALLQEQCDKGYVEEEGDTH